MFYGNCVKMCVNFAPNFGEKETVCCILTMHRLTFPFPLGNFSKNIMIIVPSHPLTLFPPIGDKTERPPF
jgi:hypothetical protein